MDSKLHTYTAVKNAVSRMLEGGDVVRGSSTEHSLSILDQKWASVYSKIHERKVTLTFSSVFAKKKTATLCLLKKKMSLCDITISPFCCIF